MAMITNVNPTQVHPRGGTEITVTGSGFTGTSKVCLQDQNGKKYDVQYTVDSDSQITLLSPDTGGRLGSHDVIVYIGGDVATTPLVDSLVPDGDHLSATGTGGATLVKVQNNANRVYIRD